MGYTAPGHGPSTADPAAGHVDQDRQRAEDCAASMAPATASSSVTSPPTATVRLTQLLGQLAGPVGIAVEDRHPHPARPPTGGRWPPRARRRHR